MTTTVNIEICRLPVGTKILIETERRKTPDEESDTDWVPADIWDIEVVEPSKNLVRVYGTHEAFKGKPPVILRFVRSIGPKGETLPGCLVKGWHFVLAYSNADHHTFPVRSARIEGPGWHYEAFA